MNKDIFLKLAIYFGMNKCTNFGIRYSIILQKKTLRRLRLRFFFSKVFQKSEAGAIKNMIQTCMYKKVYKTTQNVLLVIELILDKVKLAFISQR